MTLSFVVVCEAPPDQETACGLADRVFCEQVDWLEPDHLPYNRRWRGLEPHEPLVLWKDIPKIAQSQGIRVHGHFDGQPGEADAKAARRALLLIMRMVSAFDGVLLVRDSDGDTTRKTGLEQARNGVSMQDKQDKIVIGVAHPMRECWVLAGFEPQDGKEADRLSAMRSELGIDPQRRAHELTAKNESAKNSPKRVLSELTLKTREREIACWECTDLAELRDRGEESGLKAYLDEVVERLVPLIRGH